MRSFTLPRVLSAAVLVLLSLVLPWHKVQSQPPTWKVAIVLPITGPLSPIGEKLKRGYQLALKEAQKKGQNLEVLWVDEKLLSQKETLAKALQAPHTIAILGAYSSHATFTLAGMAERLRIPLIIPSSMADRITRQGYQWVFRICPSSSQYLEEFISYLVALFPSPPTTALLYEDTPWGHELQKKLTKILKERWSIQPVALVYTPGANHYPEIVKAVRARKPSLVILASSATDTVALYKNLKASEIPCLVASSGMGLSSPSLLEKVLPLAPGLLFPSPWIPQANWSGNQEFAIKYKEAYGEPADYHAAETYSALSILSQALEKARCSSQKPSCRKKIKRILEHTTFPTPLGPVKFTSNEGHTHQNRLPPLIIQIQGSKAVVVSPPEGATGKIQLSSHKGD